MANTCTIDGCTRPVMYKKLGLCQAHYMAQRRAKEAEKEDSHRPEHMVIPAEIIDAMSKARTTEDWQALAAAFTPILAKIMAGGLKASAGQVSLIKDIMNRAYGKPVATQADKVVSTGVVLLPVIGKNEKSIICPQCTFDALAKLDDDSTRDLGVKVLRELLERLIAEFKPKPEVVS